MVRPLSPDKQQQLSLEAFKRILAAESKLVIVEIQFVYIYNSLCMAVCKRDVSLFCISFMQKLQLTEEPVR